MQVDVNLILRSIADAYDTFAGLGFETDVSIEDYNMKSGQIVNSYVFKALWINKPTIRVSDKSYSFLTEAHPSAFIRTINLPVDGNGNPITPRHS
jgi:hypothetical protein